MSLEEKLAQIRAGSADRVPQDKLEVMHRETVKLRESGIADRVVEAGETLPAFALPDVDGEVVRSEDLLARGPLVVTVYRGVW